MKCPNCNSENAEGNLFCELCGTKLTAAVSRPARTSILTLKSIVQEEDINCE